MKKFAYSLLFVLAGLFLVDRLGGMAMQWVNYHSNDSSAPKIKYLINDVHEDIILFGTSRCQRHYVPSIISDSLGMSVYNGGLCGADNILAHYTILTHVVSHHTPKIVCLELMVNDYAAMGNPFKTISWFAPYFGHNEQADSIYRLAGTYWPYKISHLYRYNAKAIQNMAGLVINSQTQNEHGHIPLPPPTKLMRKPEAEDPPTNIDPLKLEYIHRFIRLCKEKGIQVVFMVSPQYTEVQKMHYDVLKQIARQYNTPFLDYHTNGQFHDHPEYFRDAVHLCGEGAKLYSSMFAHDLKQILQHEQ